MMINFFKELMEQALDLELTVRFAKRDGKWFAALGGELDSLSLEELEKYRAEFKDVAKSDEDVLSLALFPQVAPKFLAWRDGPHDEPASAPAEKKPAAPADPNAVRELYVEYKG